MRIGRCWGASITLSDLVDPLVDEGLYAVVRHPLYASLDLMYMGSALALLGGNVFASAAALVAMAANCMRGRNEERLLRQVHGGAWLAYAENTPFMFPRLRRP